MSKEDKQVWINSEIELIDYYNEGKYDEIISMIEDNIDNLDIEYIKEDYEMLNLSSLYGKTQTDFFKAHFIEKDKLALLKIGELIGTINTYNKCYYDEFIRPRVLEYEKQITEEFEDHFNRIEKYHKMPHISVQKFLSKYYNIRCENLNSLTHEELEEIFDIIPCIKTPIVSDKVFEAIRTGKIVLVNDNHYIFGYENPLLEKSNEECEELFEHPVVAEFYRNLEKETGLRRQDIEELKMYELENLLKECKKISDDVTKRIIIKELHKRKELENNTKEEKLEKVRKREYREELIK